MKRFVLFILMAACATGCDDRGISPDYSSISDPRDRWHAHRIHDYTIGQIRGCFCPDGDVEYEITVRNDSIISVVRADIMTNVPTAEWGKFRTIERLFDMIDATNPDSVAVLQVAYDPAMGFPTTIYLDVSAYIADEEVSYTTRFIRVEGTTP